MNRGNLAAEENEMKQPSIRRVALGFRAHSGWAAMVALSDPLDAPTILDRRPIEIADANLAGSKQPFHAAQPLDLTEAEKLIATCVEASVQLARKAVAAAIDDIMRKGYRVSGSGILTGSGRALPTLEKILSSHPLLHTAEGELFRNAVAAACRNSGLSVTSVKEKEVLFQSASVLGISERAIQQHLVRMGESVGPPWRQDEKLATLVAWVALAAEIHGIGNRNISTPTKQSELQSHTGIRKHGIKSC